MVAMRLRCVVMLTVFALVTLGNTAKAAARAAGAAEAQIHGPSTLRLPFQRRRRLANFVESAATLPIVKSLANTSVGKWVLQSKLLESAFDRKLRLVTEYFHVCNVKDVGSQGFFKSPKFIKWETEVKATYKDDAEKLMFLTMNKELKASDDGGVEAVIAQAINDKDTRDVGLRFENMLLQEWAGNKKTITTKEIRKYIRYAIYRDSGSNALHEKMQTLMGDVSIYHWMNYYEEFLMDDAKTIFAYLDENFRMMSGEREVADVFMKLRPLEGFNNNAFLLEKLYQKASDTEMGDEVASFVLSKLDEANWSKAAISNHLLELQKHDFAPYLREKLLDPMTQKLAQIVRDDGLA